jgi:hypothetical protein
MNKLGKVVLAAAATTVLVGSIAAVGGNMAVDAAQASAEQESVTGDQASTVPGVENYAFHGGGFHGGGYAHGGGFRGGYGHAGWGHDGRWGWGRGWGYWPRYRRAGWGW